MKNKFFALLVLLALFGFTATGAQANPWHHHYHHFYHHHYFYHGQWYDYDDESAFGPGAVIQIGL